MLLLLCPLILCSRISLLNCGYSGVQKGNKLPCPTVTRQGAGRFHQGLEEGFGIDAETGGTGFYQIQPGYQGLVAQVSLLQLCA
jgi:hypothetical protein